MHRQIQHKKVKRFKERSRNLEKEKTWTIQRAVVAAATPQPAAAWMSVDWRRRPGLKNLNKVDSPAIFLSMPLPIPMTNLIGRPGSFYKMDSVAAIISTGNQFSTVWFFWWGGFHLCQIKMLHVLSGLIYNWYSFSQFHFFFPTMCIGELVIFTFNLVRCIQFHSKLSNLSNCSLNFDRSCNITFNFLAIFTF